MTNDDQDYKPQNYQDDLDTKGVDIVTHEQTDDPVKGFGVPANEFRKELNHLDGEARGDEDPEFEEDMREHVEDMDQGDNGRD